MSQMCWHMLAGETDLRCSQQIHGPESAKTWLRVKISQSDFSHFQLPLGMGGRKQNTTGVDRLIVYQKYLKHTFCCRGRFCHFWAPLVCPSGASLARWTQMYVAISQWMISLVFQTPCAEILSVSLAQHMKVIFFKTHEEMERERSLAADRE